MSPSFFCPTEARCFFGKNRRAVWNRSVETKALKERKVMNNRINTDTVVADLKTVVRDSEQLLEAVTGVTGEKAEALRQRLSETMERARQTCGKLEAKTKESLEATDKIIREHPYQSLGVALAVGVVIGALVARK
jgi:ElaB/YqjD/DUF883 family membrane-anchored ribosome-binding protein